MLFTIKLVIQADNEREASKAGEGMADSNEAFILEVSESTNAEIGAVGNFFEFYGASE